MQVHGHSSQEFRLGNTSDVTFRRRRWDRHCHRKEMHRFRRKLVNWIGNNQRWDQIIIGCKTKFTTKSKLLGSICDGFVNTCCLNLLLSAIKGLFEIVLFESCHVFSWLSRYFFMVTIKRIQHWKPSMICVGLYFPPNSNFLRHIGMRWIKVLIGKEHLQSGTQIQSRKL